MKKKIKIVFTIYLFLLMILLIPINNVVALPTNWVELTDFDDYNLGDYSGSESDFNWSSYDNNYEIAGTVEDPYLENIYHSGWNTCFMNSTVGGYFGYYIKGYYGAAPTYYYFYNSSGTNVVTLFIDYASGAKFYYVDYNGNNQLIYNFGVTSPVYYFSWQYYTDNIMQYKVYDSSLVLKGIVNGTGKVSGGDYTTKEQFNCSMIKVYTSSSSSGLINRIYEYGYISEDLEEEEGCPEINGVIIETDGLLGLKDVISGTYHQYNCTVIGDIGSTVFIRIFNQSFNLVWAKVFTLDSSEQRFTFYVWFYSFWDVGLYYMNISDYIITGCGDWYNYSGSFNVNGLLQEEYYDLYYNGGCFAEFDTLNTPYYFVGDNIGIVYYLVENSSATNFDEQYKYRLTLYRNNQVFRTYYSTNNDVGSVIINHACFGDYTQSGVYQIFVYNITVDDSIYNIEYISDTLTVYDSDSDGDGIPDEFDDNDDSDSDGGIDGLSSEQGIIVGLIVSLGLGIGFAIVTKTIGVVPLVSIPCVYVFSLESMNKYQFFPTEVGAGIIVVLVIVGVMMYFFK